MAKKIEKVTKASRTAAKTAAKTINRYPFTRHVVLALCAVVVFIFAATIMLSVFTRHNTHKIVPDLKGMKVEEAIRAARRASVKLEVIDSLYIPSYEPGIILEQLPAPGSEVKAGRRVFLTINSFHRKRVTIPYVTGFSLRQAKNNLEIAGLEIEKLIYRSDIATNNVLEERYEGKEIKYSSKIEAEVGTGVTLVVGVAPNAPSPVVPKAVGFTLKEAKSRIWEAGLNIGKVEFEGDIDILDQSHARVYSQTPGYASRSTYGAPVNIKLTLDMSKTDKSSEQSDNAARKAIKEQDAAEEAKAKEGEKSADEQ